MGADSASGASSRLFLCPGCGAYYKDYLNYCVRCGGALVESNGNAAQANATAGTSVSSVDSPAVRSDLSLANSLVGVGSVGIVSGVILTIWGFVLHSHNNSLSAVCSSGLGQIGQVLSPNDVGTSCSHWAMMSDVGIGMAVTGILLLIGGLRVAVFALHINFTPGRRN